MENFYIVKIFEKLAENEELLFNTDLEKPTRKTSLEMFSLVTKFVGIMEDALGESWGEILETPARIVLEIFEKYKEKRENLDNSDFYSLLLNIHLCVKKYMFLKGYVYSGITGGI